MCQVWLPQEIDGAKLVTGWRPQLAVATKARLEEGPELGPSAHVSSVPGQCIKC